MPATLYNPSNDFIQAIRSMHCGVCNKPVENVFIHEEIDDNGFHYPIIKFRCHGKSIDVALWDYNFEVEAERKKFFDWANTPLFVIEAKPDFNLRGWLEN